MAMQKCGDASCEIVMQYSNQCVAASYGRSKTGVYWRADNGLTQKEAEQNTIKKCSKRAKSCKVFLSECSLP